MTQRMFKKTNDFNVSAKELFAWHARPGAFERLVPPWDKITVLERAGGIQDGGRLLMAVHQGPFRLPWEARHHGYQEGVQFCDTQVRGPFARWEHTHRCIPVDATHSRLEDEIAYALPFGRLGDAVGGWFVRRMLSNMFTYRHRRTEVDLDRHAKFSDRGKQRVAITGASGLIGKALAAFLSTGGHEVWSLVRRQADKTKNEIAWSPDKGEIDAAALEGMDIVIHLAAENVGNRRWSPAQKREIIASRTRGTHLIASTLASLKHKPRAFLSASAIGFYGDRDAQPLTESAAPGTDFLAEVCTAWETATAPAQAAGIRTVMMRIGVVLTPSGGALAKMLTPFKLGLGGPIGSGTQYFSWIGLDDTIGAIHHLMFADTVSGPVNLTAPQAVPQRAFAKSLGKVLGRPAILPLPKFAAKLVLGELGDVVLGGANIQPAKLLASGFQFHTPTLEEALRHELGHG